MAEKSRLSYIVRAKPTTGDVSQAGSMATGRKGSRRRSGAAELGQRTGPSDGEGR